MLPHVHSTEIIQLNEHPLGLFKQSMKQSGTVYFSSFLFCAYNLECSPISACKDTEILTALKIVQERYEAFKSHWGFSEVLVNQHCPSPLSAALYALTNTCFTTSSASLCTDKEQPRCQGPEAVIRLWHWGTRIVKNHGQYARVVVPLRFRLVHYMKGAPYEADNITSNEKNILAVRLFVMSDRLE